MKSEIVKLWVGENQKRIIDIPMEYSIETLSENEKKHILKTLEHFDGNKTQAANALGITIKTLYNKLHEYGEFEKYAVHKRIKKAVRTSYSWVEPIQPEPKDEGHAND